MAYRARCAVCVVSEVVLTARRSIHVIHRSYDYGRISTFAGELVGLMGLFALFLVGAAISSVRRHPRYWHPAPTLTRARALHRHSGATSSGATSSGSAES